MGPVVASDDEAGPAMGFDGCSIAAKQGATRVLAKMRVQWWSIKKRSCASFLKL